MAEHGDDAKPARWTRYVPAHERARGFECRTIGAGPGVILLHEFPGVMPTARSFGEHLAAQGFTVVLPLLFGPQSMPPSTRQRTRALVRLCVMREFKAFALDADGEITEFLRSLAEDLAERTPGRGVGIIGMCLTGGFALAATIGSDDLVATVVSQPSLPAPITPARRRSVGVPAQRLRRFAEGVPAGEACVLGLRYSRDRLSPDVRFAALERHLGSAFEVFPLYSGADSVDGTPAAAHSTLTSRHPGLQEFAARERTFEFLRERLLPRAGSSSEPDAVI
jgi:dienelactone hydrolase